MTAENSCAKLRTDQEVIVARDLLCGQEGILRAQFCVVDPTPPEQILSDSNQDSGQDQKKKLKDQLPYEESEFDIPTLMVRNVQDLDKQFNETLVIQRKCLGSVQAVLADENQHKNFIIFRNPKEEEAEHIEKKMEHYMDQAVNFYNTKHHVEMYKDNLQLCWDPYGRLVDILKYGQSLNIELRGVFNPDIITSQILSGSKQVCFLANKSDQYSVAQIFTQNKKIASELYEALRRSLNIEPAKPTYIIASESRAEPQVASI